MQKPRPKQTILIIFGFWMLWGFGYETVWHRLTTNVEGTVISVRDIPYPTSPARHGTAYMFRDARGHTIAYIAGATDATLPRNMPVGSHIRKRPWHWSYEQDGQEVHDSGPIFYTASLAMALGCIIWGIRLRDERQA